MSPQVASSLAALSAAPSEALGSLFVAVGLAAARTVPITWLVPAFGGPRAGAVTRVGLGLALAALVLPRLLPGPLSAPLAGGATTAHAGALFWLIVIAREVLIGTTVGLVASAPFHAAASAGWLSDLLRGGGGAAGAARPPPAATESTSSPIADLYLLLAIVIFLRIGGVGQLASALSRSYDAVPLGVGPAGATAALRGAAAIVVTASARLIESAVGLAAPVMVALLLADVAFALAFAVPARVWHRGPLPVALAPARALLGIGVVLAGLGVLDGALAGGFRGWLELAERAFAAWRR